MTLRGFETPASSWDQDTSWQLNISNVNPNQSPGDPEVGITFMAPPSGRVWIIVGGGGRDNSGTNRVFLKPELYIGSQALAENLLDDGAFKDFVIPGEADESIYGSRTTMFTDLVPLRQHYARVVHSVEGGTSGDLFVREIAAVPLP